MACNIQCHLQSLVDPALLVPHLASVSYVLSLCCLLGTVLDDKTALRPLETQTAGYKVVEGKTGDSKINCQAKGELGVGLVDSNLRKWQKQGWRCSSTAKFRPNFKYLEFSAQ